MKIAVIGATGLVGGKMMDVLEELEVPFDEFIPVGSERSVGHSITFKGSSYPVKSIREALEQKPDVALFSAGGDVSAEYAPQFAEAGTYVIDNSSAWRMDPGKKLIVPEINGNILEKNDRIIANPNCSTIQLVLTLFPLNNKFGLKRVVVSTYQSVSGSGQKGINQLMSERKGEYHNNIYPHSIDLNCLPQCDVFTDNGYTKEEMKVVNESRKILNIPDLKVTCTAVRVPVTGGHSESVNVELHKNFELKEIREALTSFQGITVQDDPENKIYPMPIDAFGKNDVFVGRIRRDESVENGINVWIVADNLRKGAATNAVQILNLLRQKGFIGS